MAYLHGPALVTAAKKAVGKKAYSSMCQAFCVITAGIGAKGDFDGDRDADAVDGWKKAKARGKVVEAKDIKNIADVPAGTIAYWTGGSRGYGHAAITIGNGQIVSTDAPTWGKIGIVTIPWIAAHWKNNLKFVGYVVNDGDGHQMVDDKPKPAPAPPSDRVVVISADQNMAGLNSYGKKTAKARVARYVAARRAVPVDVINTQEADVASGIRPALDSGLKPLGYGRTKGGKARYQWVRGSVKVIASGLITTPSSTWWRRDDKQAAWVVYEKQGVRAMDVSMHLESDIGSGPDAKRVEQAKAIVGSALSIAKQNGVDRRNVLVVGDTNSNSMVLTALVKLGWRNCAAGTKYEKARTFMGWDGKKHDRYDYALVAHDAAPARVVSVADNTKISDHAGLRVERELTH